jgi:hypothetical protein
MIEEEIWKAAPYGIPYEVSNLGRVRRSDNKKIVCIFKNPKQRRTLVFYVKKKEGKKRGSDNSFLVSRLIKIAFHGEPPKDKPFCRHLDDVAGNDKLSNLEWGDYKDNSADMMRNGNHARGMAKRDGKAAGQKIAAKLRGKKQPQETIDKRNAVLAKLVYITNDIKTRRVDPALPLPEGWRIGSAKGRRNSEATKALMSQKAKAREARKRLVTGSLFSK